MNKKIIAFFCSTLFILNCFSTLAVAYSDIPEDTNESRIVEIISDMGIMQGYEDGSFMPSKAISRSEFVTVLHNAIGFWNSGAVDGGSDSGFDGFNWYAAFLGDGSMDTSLLYPPEKNEASGEEATAAGRWTDVGEDYWAYKNLYDVSESGYIKGYPDGTFKPDASVTYNEAIKVILSICGYTTIAEGYGGYPTGYINIANQNKLSTGISVTGDSPLSRMDAATLIYNSFTIELASSAMDDSEIKKNFLNDIIGIYTLEGMLESTDISSVYPNKACDKFTAKIGDIYFSFDESKGSIRDYLGRDLRVYLKENDDLSYTLRSFECTSRDNLTVIDAELFKEYNNNTFYYYANSSSNKTKSISVRAGSVLIYNGKLVESFDSTFFDKLNQGTVTLIKKNKAAYDIIVIENYNSGYTDQINVKNMEITNKLKEGTGDALISLDKDDNGDAVIYEIVDADGNNITLDDMGTGAINYYSNDNYVKIYYTQDKISGTVSGVSNDDDYTKFELSGTEYRIAKQYNEYRTASLRNGMSITAYLDMFNDVVWLTDETDMEGYAYIIETITDESQEGLIVTYFDIDSNSVKEAKTAYSVRYYDVYGTSRRHSTDTLKEALLEYDGIVKLGFDTDEKINSIMQPLEKSQSRPDMLKTVLASNNDSTSIDYMGNYAYEAYSFSGRVFLDANTVVLNIPTEREDKDYYKLSSYTTITASTNGILFKLYSFDVDSPFAKLALIYTQADTKNYFNEVPHYVVLDVSEAINEDDELVTELKLLDPEKGENRVVTAEKKLNGFSVFENAYNAFMEADADGNFYTIRPGDIIQLAEDPVDNSVIAVRILFDADGINPAWCCKDFVNKPTSCPAENHTHSVATLGTICGCTGVVKQASNNTNPFGYTNGNVTGYARVPGSRNCWQMFTDGFIHSIKEGLVRITTQNLAEEIVTEPDLENFYWAFDNPASVIWLVTKNKNGSCSVEHGTLSDIKTYAQAGNDCDRCFIYNSHGSMKSMVVFKND